MFFVRRGANACTYLDGKLLETTYARQLQREGPLDLNHSWSLGTFDGNNNPGSRQVNYSFKGRLDEIMVFTRALTDAEVAQIYNLPK